MTPVRDQMLRVAFAVLTIVLSGSASAAGWRSLRVDGGSEESFKESVALFQEKLSPSRRHAFERELQGIWNQQAEQAAAEQHEYTAADYLAQLDGLAYKQVVELPDPTGGKAAAYRREYYASRPPPGPDPLASSSPNESARMPVYGTAYRGLPQTANGAY